MGDSTPWYKKILSWFILKRPETGSMHPDFNPIDTKAIAFELNLEGNAKAQGEKNLPPQDQVDAFGLEYALLHKIAKKRTEHISYFVNLRKSLELEESKFSFLGYVSDALEAPKKFEIDAAQVLDDYSSALRTASNKAKGTKEELSKFKVQNELERQAEVPSGINRTIKIVFVIFLLAIEAVLNANFFASGLDGGLLAGIVMAATCAFFNLVFPLGLGRLFTNINHINPIRKGIALACLGMTIFLMTTIALGIGHLRDALNTGSLEYQVIALASLRENPFVLNDLFSYLLAGISVLFALAAFVDAYFFHDVYPGYTKITKKAQQAEADYEDLISQLRDELSELKDDSLQSIDNAIHQAENSIEQLNSLIAKKHQAQNSMELHLSTAQNGLNSLVSEYRMYLAQYRANGQPVRNRVILKLDKPETPSFSSTATEASLKTVEDAYKNLLAQAQQLKSEINKGYDGLNTSVIPTEKVVERSINKS